MAGIIQKLFKNQKPKEQITSNPPAEEKPERVEPPSPAILEPPQLLVGCAQSIGKQREHNEDSLFMLTSTMGSVHAMAPFGLYIVADGMGGHRFGEVASEIAVRTMANYIVRRLYHPMLVNWPNAPDDSIQEAMHEGIMEAHRAILKEVPGGGTTLTAALIFGDQLTIAHVGDTRAYVISAGGDIIPLTQDHSLVKRLVELGQLTDDEAAIHPQRNVLYRALGQGEAFEPDVSTFPLPETGFILLCSDGLWGVVPEQQLVQLSISNSSLSDGCQGMVEAANAAGGPDNITAILVRLPG